MQKHDQRVYYTNFVQANAQIGVIAFGILPDGSGAAILNGDKLVLHGSQFLVGEPIQWAISRLKCTLHHDNK